jgi:hypothetical protein
MDPISAGLGIVGLGISLFEGMKQSQTASQIAGVSQGIAQDEQQINAQKMLQQQMEARRSSLENVRNAQRLRAQATASATNQGASQGSGLQAGLAGVTDTAAFNQQGITQASQISQSIYGINTDISSKKVQLAGLQGQMSTEQGYASLGAGIMKGGPIIGAFGKDIYSGATGGGWGFGTTS